MASRPRGGSNASIDWLSIAQPLNRPYRSANANRSVERLIEVVGHKAHDLFQHLAEVVIELLVERVVARVVEEHRVLAVRLRPARVEAEPLLELGAHADHDEVLGEVALGARGERAPDDVVLPPGRPGLIRARRRDADELVDHAEMGGDRDPAERPQEGTVRRRERDPERLLGGGDGSLGHRAGDLARTLALVQAAADAFDELDGLGRHGGRLHYAWDARRSERLARRVLNSAAAAPRGTTANR